MESFYDAARVEHIKDVMPKILGMARPNDRIVMGMTGDPLLASNARREEGTIASIDGSVVNVRMDTGQMRELDSTSMHPGNLFEFTEDTFMDVMKRNVEMNGMHPYRGSNSIPTDIPTMHKEFMEFQNSVIDTLAELSNDISKMSTEKTFAQTFVQEYRGSFKK